MANKSIYEEEKGLTILDHRNYPEGIQEYMKLEELFLCQNLQDVKSLLEIGCGDGRYLEILASSVGEILGIDYSEHLVNVSKQWKSSYFRKWRALCECLFCPLLSRINGVSSFLNANL